MKIFQTALLTTVFALPAVAQQAPYAGLDSRGIAALSDEDIADLEAGRGWGLALPAELNGYPGPTHVLELADDLDLSTEQRAEIEAIFAAMNSRARELGAELIAAETALDAAFAEGEIDVDRLTAMTAEAARIEGELRAVHLAAHLEVTPLLTRHQRVIYAQSRGYGDASHGGGEHGHD
ncbi:hypothetical protein HKCCE3408_03095 [Rhodobacterales bacterium HKCCE3408]|nr:hypothetical protein [Rhodobacterales bacterium HKCCE3408]